MVAKAMQMKGSLGGPESCEENVVNIKILLAILVTVSAPETPSQQSSRLRKETESNAAV